MKPNYDVFISFADEDKAFATQLYHALHQQGIRAWCSAAEVAPAEGIYTQVREALAQSKYFLLIISEHYGRPWHELEFDNAAHVRASMGKELIIPVMYGVDYTYVERNPLFSLITNLRMVDTYEKPVETVAHEIRQKIAATDAKGVKLRQPSKFASLLRNKIVLMGMAAVLALGVYLATDAYQLLKNHLSKQEAIQKRNEASQMLIPTESFVEEPSLADIPYNFAQEDEFDFQVVNIRPDRNNECTEDKFPNSNLTTLVVNLLNKTKKKNLIIRGIQVEVRRNTQLIIDNVKASLYIDANRGGGGCESEYGVISLELPHHKGNVRYEYTLEGKAINCKKDEPIELPMVIYQLNKQNQMVMPNEVKLIFTFITNENNIEAMSRRFSFSGGNGRYER
jgi:hypothetical protein